MLLQLDIVTRLTLYFAYIYTAGTRRNIAASVGENLYPGNPPLSPFTRRMVGVPLIFL